MQLTVRTSLHYDDGLVSDQRVNWAARSNMADAKFAYDRDSQLQVKRVRGRVGGQTVHKIGFYYGRERSKKLLQVRSDNHQHKPTNQRKKKRQTPIHSS